MQRSSVVFQGPGRSPQFAIHQGRTVLVTEPDGTSLDQTRRGCIFRHRGHQQLGDLRHKLDIRFWREDGETAFEVIKGNAEVVERCDVVAKVAALREGCGFNEWADARAAPRRSCRRAAKDSKLIGNRQTARS